MKSKSNNVIDFFLARENIREKIVESAMKKRTKKMLCELCGEYSPCINGACDNCREKYEL